MHNKAEIYYSVGDRDFMTGMSSPLTALSIAQQTPHIVASAIYFD